MVYYGENIEANISGDASTISLSYLFNIRKACYTEDSLEKIQPMVSQDYSFCYVPQEALKNLLIPLYLISVSP